jgi:hypothetical protein
MKTTQEKQALQNFADKFNLLVLEYIVNDKRKKQTYFLIDKDQNSICHPMDYNYLNCFLLGIDKAIKFNIKSNLKKDYFKKITETPLKVQEPLCKFWDNQHELYLNLINELNKVGWTCKYSLNGELYGLHPIQDF